ncbi:MAG TPA: hypothetical protein VGN69_03475 [Solirubrobacteraceae bacterium]|nr:hypothetical protein [Solirubrobacteraceae bacterium]
METLSEAADLLVVAEAAAVAAPATSVRRNLHRTAALAALTAALAAQRMQRPAGEFLRQAQDHANGAGDGPLKAQVLMLHREEDCASRHIVSAGSETSVELLRGAIDAAGVSVSASSVRAGARYRLAWELAALGQVHGALQELEAADADVELASPAPDYIEDSDLHTGGAAAWRGMALRMAHCPAEAEAALTEAIATRPKPTTSLVVLAKLKAETDDVDAAVAALEDGFLLARTVGDARPQADARTLAGRLPDCTAVRSLRELLRA